MLITMTFSKHMPNVKEFPNSYTGSEKKTKNQKNPLALTFKPAVLDTEHGVQEPYENDFLWNTKVYITLLLSSYYWGNLIQ